jgi:hypothetical protein
MKSFRLLSLAAISLAASNCMLLSGRCVYELRGVNTSGSVLITSSDSVHAELTVDEQRDFEPDKNMSWQITGPSLKGHVTRITLEDNSASPRTLYDFPLAPSSIPMLSNGFVRHSEGANLNGFFDLLGDNRGFIIIRTDLTAQPIVTIRLLTTFKSDWNRPYCS